MKKKLILLVMLVSLLAVSLALFLSCEEPGDESLPGTWIASYTRADYAAESGMSDAALAAMGFPEEFDIAKLVFTETTFMYYNINPKDGEEELEAQGTYTVDGSNVTFTSGGGSTTGTLSGNKLTVEIDGEETVFTKK